MDWRYSSSNRVPALQVRSPDFKPQFNNNKTKCGLRGGRSYESQGEVAIMCLCPLHHLSTSCPFFQQAEGRKSCKRGSE
jgi:hypothetical protein